MIKKSLISTNLYLRDSTSRQEMLRNSILTSTAIECDKTDFFRSIKKLSETSFGTSARRIVSKSAERFR